MLLEADKFYIKDSITRTKRKFVPLHKGFVGMYVCGPTVYNDVHLGNCRTFLSFDLLYRYLKHLGYSVRYVRNITDVGHLENDSDDGEDKMQKKAIRESLEPMEVAKRYTQSFHDIMNDFNALPPNIEPIATGHITEQIEMIEEIIKNGFAYVSNGSVYFDVHKFSESNNYGKVSGRNIEDLRNFTRELKGGGDKKNPEDFALWKKASDSHIMRWNCPWGAKGFPGWHLECSVMSRKYLGEKFDIHGGGMDLKFPHHECENAQSVSAYGKEAVQYWVHTNMLTLDGKRMSKTEGNFILPQELFTGENAIFSRPFSPMTVKFYMSQAHYATPLDLKEEGLIGSEKGLKKLFETSAILSNLPTSENGSIDIQEHKKKCYEAMNDDCNSPKLIAELFAIADNVKKIQSSEETISKGQKEELTTLFHGFFYDVLGMRAEKEEKKGNSNELLEVLVTIRNKARTEKNFELSDFIRDELQKKNITLKDSKDGTTWEKL